MINLGQYADAATHLLTALSIQEFDAAQVVSSGDGGGGGRAAGAEDDDDAELDNATTSQSLWDSLNLALLMMHRSDLAQHCRERDLSYFKSEFTF